MPLTLQLQSTASAPAAFGALSVGPISFAGSIAPQVTNINLQSGNNTLTVPAGAIGCIIAPPSPNAIVLKWKTTSGDVGVDIPQQTPSPIIFDQLNVPTTAYINAASNTTGQTQILWF